MKESLSEDEEYNDNINEIVPKQNSNNNNLKKI